MIEIVAGPLQHDAFASFGAILRAPAEVARIQFPNALQNRRAGAQPTLTASRSLPATLPLTSQVMERHRYSTQTFLPLDASRYLIVVAPNESGGAPDMTAARAFLVPGDTGISYRADTWHHAHTVLDRPASFAVLMWRDGTADDIEIRQLDGPFMIRLA
jgi:ureidoglycolate lyase